MNDTELDQDARDVIAAGRDGLTPSGLQRARVRRGVDAQLVGGAVALATSSSTVPALAKLGTIAALAAGVAAGGWYVARYAAPPAAPVAPKPSATAPARAPAASAVVAAAPAPAASGNAAAPAASGNAAAPAASASAPAPSTARDANREGLSAEVELLSRANAAVSRGDPAAALELLHQYDRRFVAGRLQAERAAAGVLALCGAGRVAEARAAAERFQKRWPRSPLAARVASTCARGTN